MPLTAISLLFAAAVPAALTAPPRIEPSPLTHGPTVERSAPATPVVLVRESDGRLILTVPGARRAVAMPIIEPGAATWDVVGEDGASIVTLENHRGSEGAGAGPPPRVTTPEGRDLALEQAANDARDARDAHSGGATLTWRLEDGSLATLAVGSGVAIEIAGSEAPATAEETPVASEIAAPVAPKLEFALRPCTPNPFRRSTLLRFELPEAGHVNLSLYDVAGRRIETLVNESRTAGDHQVEYRPTSSAGGHLFARLTFVSASGAKARRATQPLVVIR